MKVIRAKVMGFCMGVRRAVELACEEASRAETRVFSLGPLIHNPRVLKELESRGVQILDEKELPANIKNPSLKDTPLKSASLKDAPLKDLSLKSLSFVIRAHGISPGAEADLRGRGGRIIDATCPTVKASQLKAQELAAAGYSLFLAGEADHAEIIGIRGYAEAGFRASADRDRGLFFCEVVSSATEAEEKAAVLKTVQTSFPGPLKTALIGQTTISAEEYNVAAKGVQKYFPGLEVMRTICAASTERQESLRRLLDQVDVVVVAGGKESANTRRLLAIAAARGKPCVLAECAEDIPPCFAAFGKAGLSAGASTPDSVIDEIERALAGKAENS